MNSVNNNIVIYVVWVCLDTDFKFLEQWEHMWGAEIAWKNHIYWRFFVLFDNRSEERNLRLLQQ